MRFLARFADHVIQYYISRPVAQDSLLGTSAFILACLEVASDEEGRRIKAR